MHWKKQTIQRELLPRAHWLRTVCNQNQKSKLNCILYKVHEKCHAEPLSHRSCITERSAVQTGGSVIKPPSTAPGLAGGLATGFSS